MILTTYIRPGRATEFEVVVSSGPFAETIVSAFSLCPDTSCEGYSLVGTCPTQEELAAARKRAKRGPTHLVETNMEKALAKAIIGRRIASLLGISE